MLGQFCLEAFPTVIISQLQSTQSPIDIQTAYQNFNYNK